MKSDRFFMTRRDFAKAASAVPLAASLDGLGLGIVGQGESSPIGEWAEDAAGLPCFRYTGPLSFDPPAHVKKEYLESDPYFLLGNYRLTLFAHASGMLQILTGERAWGRLNQGPTDWSGSNRASLQVGDNTVELIGMQAPAAQKAEKEFGIGYAQYRYPAAGVRVTRTISVVPSTKAGEGMPAFLVSITLRNESSARTGGSYAEQFAAKYAQIFAPWDTGRNFVHYEGVVADTGQEIQYNFKAHEPRPLTFSHRGRMARFEGAPPLLFLHALPGPNTVKIKSDSSQPGFIGIKVQCELDAGQQTTFHFVAGYTFDAGQIPIIVRKISAEMGDGAGPHFREQWRKAVPGFADEPDSELRREMRWNVGVLEQMATWREYYDETVIPQGMTYDYQWGMMASSRDLAQQALPFCHFNPALARGTLRFIMKRTIPDGEIKLDDVGFGWAPHSGRLTSDQQLYFFLLLNEYLRTTGDASILTEQVSYYPRESAATGSGFDHVRDAFLFLRDRIGVGQHGLVRLWNSDWNDMFFFWPTSQPYNYIFETSESHMNTAMAIAILGDLAETLRKHAHDEEAPELIKAVKQYREQLLKAFLADWGNAPFPRRMYFQQRAVGEKEMWLEPQGFTLLIPEVPAERKRALFAEMQSRLMKNEAMGPRQIEKPVQQPGTPPGQRENGGFWYALTGPVVLGVASFDRNAAEGMLRNLTFANHRRRFPNYWTGQWTAPDSLDSSLLPTEGLSPMMTYCAHAHAWPLYCYLRLKQG